MNRRADAPVIRLLMISSSYPSNLDDWRGLFMRHLVDAFARHDDLSLHFWGPPGDLPGNVACATNSAERRWLANLMRVGGIAHLIRQKRWRALAVPVQMLLILARAYRRNTAVDVYHINWLQNALPVPANHKPLLITVLGSDFQLMKLPLMRSLLRRTMRGRQVAVCPNAQWMVPALQDAFGDLAHVRFVPFGIDPDWFRVERQMGTSSPSKWVCVTRLTRDKLGTLFEWCQPFFTDGQRELHLFGPMQEPIVLPDWVHYHGPASPETLRREWFPFAQGLITLSQHAEGRPQVMLEAMAAGLPIIASALPAHSDLIVDRQTGRICASCRDVGQAMYELGYSDANIAMGARARQWVMDRVGTWDDCADRYVTLYRALLDETTK